MNTNQGVSNSSTNSITGSTNGAPAVTELTPEALIEQMRTVQTQLPAIAPLTPLERKEVRSRTSLDDDLIKASTKVLDASEKVQQALGTPAGELQSLIGEIDRWDAVASELRATLKSVTDANLVRRQRGSILAAQAYGIGKQLARNPGNAAIRPHLEEIKRLRGSLRRRKVTAPATPPPATTPATQS